MQGVVSALLFAAAVSLAHCPFHRAGDPVGIHDHPPVSVARCPADGLDQRGFRPQETLFVRIQNGDQPAFGDIQAFAQKVDPDQYIERPQPQIPQDFNAFDGVDV